MKWSSGTQGLLEIISEGAGCENLSDLHSASNIMRAMLAEEVHDIKKEAYSLKEWTDAVYYITGENRSFSSVEEAALFLESDLRRPIL